jgi:hypothetical protein
MTSANAEPRSCMPAAGGKEHRLIRVELSRLSKRIGCLT